MFKKIAREFSDRFSSNPYWYSFIFLVFLYLFYDQYIKSTSGQHLIPFSVLALMAGVIFESKRITANWLTIIIIGILAFIISYVITNAVIGSNSEIRTAYNSILNISIRRWPLVFLVLYFIFSLFFYKDKIIPKLTEGITLLQSLAVIYWVIDYDFIASKNPFTQAILIAGLLFSLYSIFHAFTNTRLSDTHKLILSIWSSIIMMLFAVDNIQSIYQNAPIEDMTNFFQSLYISLQYFLLGISSIYIIQNFIMLYRFIPRRKRFFNNRYFKELKELKMDHINRYSDKQVSLFDSLICLLLVGALFSANYYFQLVPRQFLIWMTFVLFPFIVLTYNHFLIKKEYSFILFPFLFLILSCNNKESQVQQINSNEIHPNKIVHYTLTSEQIEKIKTIHNIFEEVDKSSLEQTITDFKRDVNPDSEIEIWMQMANAYEGYISKNKKNLEKKKRFLS